MIKSEKNRQLSFLVFLGVFLVISLFGAFNTPLFDEDEGFFAEAARKMVETGDYIKIQVNGEERYDKPALFFWMEAISMQVFGINEFAVRLPSFICFILLGIYLFRFVRKTFGLEKARLSAAILIGILQFQLLSKAAVTDNLLNLCLVAGLFHYLAFTKSRFKKDLRLFYIFLGLGFLTKGPVAWVIPALVILPYHIVRKEWKAFLKLIDPIGLLLWLLIPLIWFYPAFKSSGEFMIIDFFLKHNLGRFSETMESHGGQLWYYVPVLFLAFIPFTHFFNKKLFRSFLKGENLFFTLWFGLTFLLFSFSKTQLPHYITYGYIPLIILMVKNHSESASMGFKIQIVLLILIFITLPLLITHFSFSTEKVFLNELLLEVPQVFGLWYYVFQCTLLILLLVFIPKSFQNFYVLLSLFIASTALFMSHYGNLQQGFVKEAGLTLRESDEEVYMTNHYNPSLSFYAQQTAEMAKGFEAGKLYFISIDKFKAEEMELLSKGSGFVLVRVL